MPSRRASHAGSWYSANPTKLANELDVWLASVPADQKGKPGVKAVVGPHAGFAYSGETAAWAYSQADPGPIKRVFVLGPSHRFYLPDCALTKCDVYETPLGDVPIDVEVVAALRATGLFRDLSLKQDEAEHCVELHLPFVRRLFAPDVKLVPIVVGSLTHEREEAYGELLAPYFNDPATLVAISTDFCHWGPRFGYTLYLPPSGPARELARDRDVDPGRAVWESIERLDGEAMDVLAAVGKGGQGTAEVHEAFSEYLERTDNTICGRHSLGVLLGAMASSSSSSSSPSATAASAQTPAWGWVKYTQSERLTSVKDSSVSYAAGWARW